MPSSPRTSGEPVAKRKRRHSVTGSEAHYEDGAYYDQAYRRRRHDVRFYTRLAAESGGPVLELGVGTGRVAFAIAKAGIAVVGVEPMSPMLEQAHQRLGRLPRAARDRVELRQGDLARLRLRRKFPLVIAPFNVWMHLYTREEIERGFATVRHHLQAGGRFAFDVLLPDPVSLARNPSKQYRGGEVPHPRGGVRYRYSEYFSYDPVTQIETIMMDFEHPEKKGQSFCTPLTQRQFFPAELEALLHYNGFALESHTGDFDGKPITDAAESQVLIARLRRASP
ncbi:MAG: class I SAM-dependent methyltransferase [Deltaproteobacteria bacterium]|nr:MAG: class I SAM-dependent methyltransferase [Deltaproteobacteria bacterium]